MTTSSERATIGVPEPATLAMTPSATARAITRAADWLREQQAPEGWWQGELETNVTMDAEDLFLRRYLGILTSEQAAATARWLRSQQRADGTWATFAGGPADLSTTVEAYAALRLAGDDPAEPHLAAAARWVRGAGGLESTRVFTRMWLALSGECSWDDLPVLPPELVLLPPRVPLNPYDFACWARQTIVAISVVSAARACRPWDIDLAELRTGAPFPRRCDSAWDRVFHALDAALHRYERRPLRALREHAVRRAVEWVVARQEADGSWGGIQPPWIWSLLALTCAGYELEHPVVRAGLAGLDRFTVEEDGPDGPVRRIEACQSPVWDTALAVVALSDAGAAPDDRALVRAGQWLLQEEVATTGDWAVRRPGAAPGGWAFEFENDRYPDTDDTAEVVLALDRVATADPQRADAAVRRALSWLHAMQSTGGGWAAFDVDNTSRLARRLPFCDFGEVVDPPSADVTAHVVEALCLHGQQDRPEVRQAVAWLLAEQEPGGSWFGRWGVNHVYGTGAAVPALVAAGLAADAAPIRAAVRWLEEHQHPSGGWGEDVRSYLDPAHVGRGAPTASQTAWALLALVAAGDAGRPAAQRGAAWLVSRQRTDGTWDEPEFTGTGFPGDFSIRYHLYRHVWPLSALGRWGRAVGETR